MSVDTGNMPITSCIPWSGWYKGNSATVGVMWGSSGTSLLKSVCSSCHRSLKMQRQLHRLILRSRQTLPPLPVLQLLPCQQPERFVTGTDVPEKVGRAVEEEADTKSIGYTTTTTSTTANALLCMAASHEVQCPVLTRLLLSALFHLNRAKNKKKDNIPQFLDFPAVYFSSTESLYTTFLDGDQAAFFWRAGWEECNRKKKKITFWMETNSHDPKEYFGKSGTIQVPWAWVERGHPVDERNIVTGVSNRLLFRFIFGIFIEQQQQPEELPSKFLIPFYLSNKVSNPWPKLYFLQPDNITCLKWRRCGEKNVTI